MVILKVVAQKILSDDVLIKLIRENMLEYLFRGSGAVVDPSKVHLKLSWLMI